MSAARRTGTLALVLGLLLLVDLAVHRGSGASEADLPTLTFGADAVDAVTLTRVSETVRLERDAEGWTVRHPFAHDADNGLVDTLVTGLASGFSVEAQVDAGDHERYGLTSERHILVALSGGGAEIAAFYVGNNAEGGSTFIRFPDDDAVYRARIGGRSRYERPAGAWRNHRIWSFAPTEVSGLVIDSPTGHLDLQRDDAGWILASDPEFVVDPALSAAIPDALAALRASAILSPDHPARIASTLEIRREGADSETIRFGSDGGQGYLQRVDGGAIYQVPVAFTDLLGGGRDAWRDRTLLSLELARITELILEEPERTTVLGRDPRTEAWTAIRPANVDIDPRQVMRVARFLAQLRVGDFVDLAPSSAGFPADTRIRIGDLETLELGGPVPGKDAIYVRVASQPGRIGTLDVRMVAAIQAAWAR